MLLRLAPGLFVLLWSTGFIGSKLGAADAEPFTFLSLRFALAALILLPFAVARASFNQGGRNAGHAALAAIRFVAESLNLDRADTIAIVFCGSKKSFAAGVPMAGVLFPGPTSA